MQTTTIRCRLGLLTLTTLTTLAAALTACSASPDSPSESSAQAVSTVAAAKPDLHQFGAKHANKRVCDDASPGGQPTCAARVQTDEEGNVQTADDPGGAGGFGAGDLARAYSIPTTVQSNQTIAIVDANDDPMAEDDLAVYRSYYGLPPCTTANGCFKKVMVPQGNPATLPQPDPKWSTEISLDLDMASAGCPSCKIILVEDDNLDDGIDKAVANGANVVSNSWYANEVGSDALANDVHVNHPGVAVFACTGDVGYDNQGACPAPGTSSCPDVPNYPASSQYAIAVGGTSLTELPAQPGAASRPSRFWTETAWGGAGSGCSTVEPKPWWQNDRGCGMRTVSDVSAVADPDTGVAFYDTWTESFTNKGGWGVIGGTSVATPLVAAIYALTREGNPSGAFWYELSSTWLDDVTSGSNGSCGGSYLCTGEPGYDGPTGMGTPNGARMANSPEVTGVSPAAGWVGSTTNVTITGWDFSTAAGQTQVTVNGEAATNVSCSSYASCTATLPALSGIGTYDVVVTVGGHASPVGSQDQFSADYHLIVGPPIRL